MNKKIDKKDFGLPNNSYDPIETINMEGRLFRSISDPKVKKSLFVRIMSVFLFSIVFFIPGLGLLCFSIYEIIGLISSGISSSNGADLFVNIAGFSIIALLGTFLMIIGVKVIRANV